VLHKRNQHKRAPGLQAEADQHARGAVGLLPVHSWMTKRKSQMKISNENTKKMQAKEKKKKKRKGRAKKR
jgi:hypothetical protein